LRRSGLRCIQALNEGPPTCAPVDLLTVALENLALDGNPLSNQRDQQGVVLDRVELREFPSGFGWCGGNRPAGFAFAAYCILGSSGEEPQDASSYSSAGTRSGSACSA
jgi:hypothetical protein